MNSPLASIYSCIIIVGLPLNSLALWILIRHHDHKLPSSVFMVNLVISDLLLIVSLFMRVYLYATGGSLAPVMFVTFTMLFRNNMRTSSIFITFIIVDRLLAVVYPLRSRLIRSYSNAVKGVLFVWLVVVAVNIPEGYGLKILLGNRRVSDPENYTKMNCPNDTQLNVTGCDEDKGQMLQSAIGYFQLVLILTMLAVNIVSTILMSRTLQRHLSESVKVKNKLNVMVIFTMNLMMFTVFFVPVSLVVFFHEYAHMFNCIASVNCCFDPLLYYFSYDGFWKKKEEVEISLARE